uniref:Uncharacterized protein n=1 Tax=Setaria italica TaxID=4555 RepID=K3YF62_SETIT
MLCQTEVHIKSNKSVTLLIVWWMAIMSTGKG